MSAGVPARVWARVRARVRRVVPRTLRGRLALLALVSTAVWLALLTVGFDLALSSRLHTQADEVLRTRAAAVAATVQARPGGGLRIREPADDRALDAGTWIYAAHTALERPKASHAAQHAADRLARGHHPAFAEAGGPAPVRLFALPVPADGPHTGTVVVSVALTPYLSTARTAVVGTALLGAFLLAGEYLVTRLVVARALQPVAHMTSLAARWSRTGAARRFGPARRPEELDALAGHLDGLLDRLAAVLRHEQRQTAEISHELRTPLARIVAEVDWLTARPRPLADQQPALESIGAAAGTMREICDTLVSTAGARDGRTPGRCAVGEVLEELARRHGEGARGTAAAGPHLRVRGTEPVGAGVPAPVLTRILAPLVDNACRYAASTVDLACRPVSGAVEISVTDDGPGVPPDRRETVFEPGRRGLPDDGHQGAGLGLPLARRLARAADGDIRLDDAPAGGARFTVRLPPG